MSTGWFSFFQGLGVTYLKPHLTYGRQVELLKGRGMEIQRTAEAEAVLMRVGYYRLSGYWYPYRKAAVSPGLPRRDEFRAGTSLDRVLALYELDRRLKLLVLDCIERIEVSLRVRTAYTIGRRGAFAHLDPRELDGRFSEKGKDGKSRYATWLSRIAEAQRRSTEDFVQHFKDKYDGVLPIWVASEIMDFGLLSTLYSGAKRSDRDEIARELGVVDSRGGGNGFALANWMRVLNYIRNVCAHHSRLWNRNITVQVASSNLAAIPELKHLCRSGAATSRVYSALSIIQFLLRDISPEYPYPERLREILDSGLESAGRTIGEMGFPDEWTDFTLWKSCGDVRISARKGESCAW
ncbi:abortive infection bacteriophage resistance protein [Amycolatopsis sulphurea]|uniref:Abortive infection bacteriophage resistance protein n=1 Tax=Amycolatopsis sulphurea TaxID=76022 RepID=A0A2A9FDR6_9PSEU|nr:abortive infection bacteriophage resistance protein [Amycolatopsis sulphurea]